MTSSLVIPNKIQDIFDACLSHAADLLRAAKKVQEEHLPNIAYHLATLALEEIGKSALVMMNYIAKMQADPSEWVEKQFEDHVRKLFWALWGPSFGREVITNEQIEFFRGMAQKIHDTRLHGLYVAVDENISPMPKDAVTESEAENLISITDARLNLEKCYEPKALNEEEQQDLSWFLTATKDKEKRNLILGKKSMDRLSELGRSWEWMGWLRKEFEQAEAEGRTQAQRELNRIELSAEEVTKAKWEFTIRFYSNSHSIRPRPLNWWNGVSTWIKLFPVNNKKNEVLAKFILPKGVPIQGVWWAGWNSARRFITALNIGSMGYFWWYIPDQISRFYENLKDLESNSTVVVERSPILKLDWKKDALSEQDLKNTALCFGMLPGPADSDKHKPFNHYITGLAFLSKNDIHIQLEANAYEQFYRAIKSGMRVYKDWDGLKPFEEAFNAVMSELIKEKEESAKYLRLGEQFEVIPPNTKGITLSEVGIMKILCDAYFTKTFQQIAQKKKETKPETSSEKPLEVENQKEKNGKRDDE